MAAGIRHSVRLTQRDRPVINQGATSGVIYQITVDGDPRRYIGSAISFSARKSAHRWMLRKGKHHCLALRSAVHKHGFEAVTVEVVETVQGQNLISREQHWLDSLSGQLFNTHTSAIGPTGRKKTPEEAEKSARHHRGKVVSAETRARLSAAMHGNENGKHQRRDTCGKGHLVTGENIYSYRVASGKIRRCCRICQQENNAKQHARRYPKPQPGEHL
jgi:group I intron endonuclease